MGHVIQQVVLNFGHDAAGGAPVARAHVRHRVSIRIGKNRLLLGNGKGYGCEIFAVSRTRALICRIKFSRVWVQRCARGGAATGAEQRARALGSVVRLKTESKASEPGGR